MAAAASSTVMEEYNEKVKFLLEKMTENPDNPILEEHLDREKLAKMKPYFKCKNVCGLLNDAMKTRLSACGWKDQVKLECNKLIQKQGIENVVLEELVDAVTPFARSSVPVEIKKDIVALLKDELIKEMKQHKF